MHFTHGNIILKKLKIFFFIFSLFPFTFLSGENTHNFMISRFLRAWCCWATSDTSQKGPKYLWNRSFSTAKSYPEGCYEINVFHSLVSSSVCDASSCQNCLLDFSDAYMNVMILWFSCILWKPHVQEHPVLIYGEKVGRQLSKNAYLVITEFTWCVTTETW